MGSPYTLVPTFHEKVWGTEDTSPWFPSGGKKIGEVWLQRPGSPLPILVKFIFTSERLSVQVHPDDDYAQVHEASLGKSEMWYILRAKPGAVIAVGLKSAISPAELQQAALSSEIEDLLNWIPVQPGDSFMVPAGTIHAIGADLALCEIQQPSDITYRLYDYGRPRQLHLEKAMATVHPTVHPGISRPITLSPEEIRLAACRHFVTDRLTIGKPYSYIPDPAHLQILIAIEGKGYLAEIPFEAGMAWAIDPGETALSLIPQGTCRLLRTFVPDANGNL